MRGSMAPSLSKPRELEALDNTGAFEHPGGAPPGATDKEECVPCTR